MLNTTTERKLYCNDSLIDTAYNVAIGTLKRIESATGDEKVLQMLNGLRADKNKINNPVFAVSEAQTGYFVSDGYDCFLVAYEYLLDQTAQGKELDTVIAKKLKSGKEKERTVLQWACVAVREYIYRHGQTDYKRAYVDRAENKDGEKETEAEAMDRAYYQVGRYYDIENEKDYVVQENIMAVLENCTERQKLIVHYRRQGKSVTEIAEKLGVSQQAISKQLAKIQGIIAEAFPETVRGFKEKRTAKAK
jgi:RNA polymerase sigma factor (sigma-70 family)